MFETNYTSKNVKIVEWQRNRTLLYTIRVFLLYNSGEDEHIIFYLTAPEKEALRVEKIVALKLGITYLYGLEIMKKIQV